MNFENNKMQVDIENLFKQNVNDLSAIKELYRKLKEVEEKILQIKYIDSTLANKLKKEYEKLKKIILDENAQAKLANDIETINSQMDNFIQEVEVNYYKKDSVNTMVNNKVTIGAARENTDVRPINYEEFDTETKQLFTGGSVAVVGEKAVGTENVKDLAITSNKRTTTGSATKISSLSPEPIKLDVNDKKLILPVSDYNLIYYNNKFDKLVSELEIDVSGNGTTCSLYYDTVSKSFKTFENGELNENCIFIGSVFWNNKDGNYINSDLNCDYVLKNGNEINHKIKGRISNNFIYPQGKEIRIFSAHPIDIDLVNKKLVINKSGYCKILINGYLRNVMEEEIDISINDYHVSIIYDATTNTLKSDLVYDSETSITKNNYLLGIIDIKNPYLSTINCNYTVNGKSYFQHLLPQRWKDKKIGCLGDSITYGAGGTSWVTRLKELTGCKEAINYGVSGTCIQENGTGKSFVERYSSMDEDLDLICVWGGVNDHHWTGSSGRKFGNINTSSSETNTFYGALKNLCEGLLNKYPTKTIMFITPMKNKGYLSGSKTCPAWNEKNGLEGGVGRTLTDYRNAIIEVCDFYSIPVLDLYALSGISPENENQVQNLMPDRLHPNTKGNLEILAPKIASFMNNL